jgi:uncharacterized membrane protein HdeD (DUF308 family)
LDNAAFDKQSEKGKGGELTMKMRSVLPMRIAKYGYIIVSAVFCIVGLAMILLPAAPAVTISNFFGIAMMIFGCVKLVGYFSKDLFRLAFQYDLEFGILLLALGIITLIKQGNRMDFICVSLGMCILADSLFKVKIAFEAKSFGVRVWWLTLALSILTAVMGLLLVFRPSESVRALTILLGNGLLAEGILGLSVAISLVKIVKNQMPDVISDD